MRRPARDVLIFCAAAAAIVLLVLALMWLLIEWVSWG